MSVRVLRSHPERLRGLLGTSRAAQPVMLVGCGSIHTFGMCSALDVALIAGDGTVLRSARGVPPGRVIGRRDACYALERHSSPGPWPLVGNRVSVVSEDGAPQGIGVLEEGRRP
ncbi:MAG: DUF192 domain-containing protein [Atopobiaceae bacterium]